MFSSYSTEIDAKGNWSEKNRLWPLFFSTSRRDFSHFHAPEYIFMTSPGFDRLFGPWVYLWTQDRQGHLPPGQGLLGPVPLAGRSGLQPLGAEFPGRPGNHPQYQQIPAAFRPGHLGSGKTTSAA